MINRKSQQHTGELEDLDEGGPQNECLAAAVVSEFSATPAANGFIYLAVWVEGRVVDPPQAKTEADEEGVDDKRAKSAIRRFAHPLKPCCVQPFRLKGHIVVAKCKVIEAPIVHR